MSNIDISVILPIYGVESYIERSLLSLFNQTKTDGVEYILVNDCTRDNSMLIANQVIEKYPNLRINIIHHKTNQGLASARQTGLDAASGEYIMHLDSDDWFEPKMLEDLYVEAKRNDADIIVCDLYMNHNNNERYVKQNVKTDAIEFYDDVLQGRVMPTIWNKIIKHSYLLSNDIKSVPGINMGEDQILCAQLMCKGIPSISYLNKAYYHYCIRGNSYTGSFSDKSLQDCIANTKYISALLEERGLSKRFEYGMLQKKLRVKLICLQHSKGKRQHDYISLFPETDCCIYSHSPAKFYHRIALSQAVKGNLFIFNLIENIVKKIPR